MIVIVVIIISELLLNLWAVVLRPNVMMNFCFATLSTYGGT